MNRKVLLIIGGVVLALCLVCAVFFVAVFALGMGATQPAATVGESFMTALKNGDYAQAYGLCAPALQQELNSAQGLQQLVTNGKVQPVSWTFSSRNVDNATAQLDGTATFTSGGSGTVRIVLNQVGSNWQVVGFNLKGQ
jgi:hypothetical protein